MSYCHYSVKKCIIDTILSTSVLLTRPPCFSRYWGISSNPEYGYLSHANNHFKATDPNDDERLVKEWWSHPLQPKLFCYN